MKITKYDRKIYAGIDNALSARDYKLHEALGEIVDNSISNPFVDSKGDISKVNVNINVDIDKREICIEDDGVGQDEEGLANSWSIGKPNDKRNSRFGVGLKQSAPSLGSIVILLSKKKGEKYVHRFVFDKEKIDPNILVKDIQLNIENIPIYETEYKEEDHFFKVIIRNLYTKYNRNTILKTKGLLGFYFGSYLKNKEMNIMINYEKIKTPPIPKLVFKKEIENKKLGFIGWWGITKKGSIGRTKKFGPDTYYNGRLITQSDLDIIGLTSRHPDYYRLESEIHFNSPTVFDDNLTSSKNSWKKNQNYNEVQKWLNDNLRLPFRRKLEKIQKDDKKTIIHKKSKFASAVIAKNLRDIYPELRKNINIKQRAKDGDLIDGYSEFDIEKRKKKDNGETQNKENVGFNGKREGKEKHKVKKPHTYIIINGTKYNIEFDLVNYLDQTHPRYASLLDKEKNIIKITINLNNLYVKYLAENNTDLFLISIGEWAIETIIKEIEKEKDANKFIDSREEAISSIDWIDYLNKIDENFHEEILENKSNEILDSLDKEKGEKITNEIEIPLELIDDIKKDLEQENKILGEKN